MQTVGQATVQMDEPPGEQRYSLKTLAFLGHGKFRCAVRSGAVSRHCCARSNRGCAAAATESARDALQPSLAADKVLAWLARELLGHFKQ
jgi:hypothetical protein